jgi:Ca2+:H+ antiporter
MNPNTDPPPNDPDSKFSEELESKSISSPIQLNESIPEDVVETHTPSIDLQEAYETNSNAQITGQSSASSITSNSERPKARKVHTQIGKLSIDSLQPPALNRSHSQGSPSKSHKSQSSRNSRYGSSAERGSRKSQNFHNFVDPSDADADEDEVRPLQSSYSPSQTKKNLRHRSMFINSGRSRTHNNRGSLARFHDYEPETTDANLEDQTEQVDTDDDREYTLKDRQEMLNTVHPFGFRLWKPALYKKSRSITRNARSALHSIPTEGMHISFVNVLWLIFFGWWMFAIFYINSLILSIIPFGGRAYSNILSGLAWYILWPFNKYVEKRLFQVSNEEILNPEHANDLDREPLLGHARNTSQDLSPYKPEFFIGKIVYFGIFYTIVAPTLILVSIINWLLVLPVPMAKLNYALFKKLRRSPLRLDFKLGSRTPGASGCLVTLCTVQAGGFQYLKYTYDGINIIFINLLSVVIFVMVDKYILIDILKLETFFTDEGFLFLVCIVSTIPLAYFIGMAVSSISAQSSLALGAVVNATFGSIVELILYAIALTEKKAILVEGSIIGSFLAGLLLLPGVSMMGGAFKKKQQRFNAKSAGVTSTMLIMSIIGVFAPTIFYSLYADFQLQCKHCPSGLSSDNLFKCSGCSFNMVHPTENEFYQTRGIYVVYACAAILPIAYIVCLTFTLKTHTKLIYSPAQPSLNQSLKNFYKKLFPDRILSEMMPAHHDSIEGNGHQVSAFNNENSEQDLHNDNSQNLLLDNSENTLNGDQLVNQESLPNNLPPIPYPHHLFDDDEDDSSEEGHGGHDAPEWSNVKSYVVLITATVLFALIAEVLIGCVDNVIEEFNVDEKLIGLTLFTLVPIVAEFVNAIAFAMAGNISLSMEIGSAYAVQVSLLQCPILVLFSEYYNSVTPGTSMLNTFTLVFPRLDMISVIFSVFLLTYIYIEGKANYFKGTILVLSYFVWLISFIFEPSNPSPTGSFGPLNLPLPNN